MFGQFNVQQYYRDYVQGGPVPTGQQFEDFPPYGHDDIPMNAWNEEQGAYHTMVRHGFQGPANHDQLWTTWGSAGTDYLAPIPQGQPLSNQQMNLVQGLTQMWTNIVWQERIGSGNYGSIWRVSANRRGMNRITGEEEIVPIFRAVKVLRIKHNTAIAFDYKVSVLLRDVHVVQDLNHRNILSVDDYIAIPDQTTHFPFSAVLIFMELCAGTLLDILQVNPFRISAEHCVLWFAPMVLALNYLHKQRIVHLDVKPANILFTIDDPFEDFKSVSLNHNLLLFCTFKLADFGFAIKYGWNVAMELTNYRGSRPFMAPELLIPGPTLTVPCDVYSLGKTLVYVYLGDRLFYSHYTHLVPHMTAQKAPQDLSDLVMHMIDVFQNRITLLGVIYHQYIARAFDPNSPFFDEVLMYAIINES